MTSSMPPGAGSAVLDAVRAWRAISDAPLSQQQRTCLAVAKGIADRALVVVARPLTDAGLALPLRSDTDWHRFALSCYQQLVDSGAYLHLADQPQVRLGDEDRIRAFLSQADPVPLRANTPLGGAELAALLDHAQDAGVLGTAGHRLHLTPAGGAAVGSLRLVVDRPAGPALASAPLTLTELVDARVSAVDAATVALTRLARHGETLLNHPTPAADTAAGRGFPALDLTTPARPADALPQAPSGRTGRRR